MTHPPEPIPDLIYDFGDYDTVQPGGCPQCGDDVVRLRLEPPTEWRCDHCRITWTPDGTGGEQT